MCSAADRRKTPFYLSQTPTVTFHFEKITKKNVAPTSDDTQALLQYDSKSLYN